MSDTASFEAFLEGWDARQGALLAELSAAKNGTAMEEANKKDLISRALSQFEEYYRHKSRAARRDAFQMFSSSWCSPLECAFYWLSGFRPTALLRLLASAVDDLSPAQILTLDRLKEETRSEEKALSDEHARIQETMATPPVVGPMQRVAWQQGSVENGGLQPGDQVSWQPFRIQDGRMQPDEAMETIRAALEKLVINADKLRTRTAAGTVEFLTTKQNIAFLEAAIRLQVNLKYGGIANHDPLSVGGSG